MGRDLRIVLRSFIDSATGRPYHWGAPLGLKVPGCDESIEMPESVRRYCDLDNGHVIEAYTEHFGFGHHGPFLLHASVFLDRMPNWNEIKYELLGSGYGLKDLGWTKKDHVGFRQAIQYAAKHEMIIEWD